MLLRLVIGLACSTLVASSPAVAHAGSPVVGLVQKGLVERAGEMLLDVRATLTEPGYVHITALRRPFPASLTDEAGRAAWRARYAVGYAADSGAGPARPSHLLVRLDREYVKRHRGRTTTLYLHGGGEGARGARSADVTMSIELPHGTAVEQRCGSLALAPASDSIVFRIRATGVTCAFARSVARRAPGPTGMPGSRQRYGHRRMRCRGRETDALLPQVRWRCERPGSLVTFRRT